MTIKEKDSGMTYKRQKPVKVYEKLLDVWRQTSHNMHVIVYE